MKVQMGGRGTAVPLL